MGPTLQFFIAILKKNKQKKKKQKKKNNKKKKLLNSLFTYWPLRCINRWLLTEYEVARGILKFQCKTWKFRVTSYSVNNHRFISKGSEPPLLAHTSSESRGTFRQKARSLAPLNGWACAVKICHDGMLEDTNSFDGAQLYCFSSIML